VLSAGLLTPPALADADDKKPVTTQAVNADELAVTDPVPLIELRTGNGALFWTLSNREAENAVANHGMTEQHTRLGYLRRQSFDGSQPIFRLRYPAGAAYLLTASAEERDALVASGDWVYEGVIGYAWAKQAEGTEVLWRMSRNGAWSVVPDERRAEYEAAGWRLDGPLGYVYPTYHRVGAVYFGTWNANTNEVLLDKAEKVYGRRDWWAGVRDFAGVGVERKAWHWPDEDFSHLEPSIGYYDDSDPHTLEKHIAQAASAGLDHFAFYWYWNPADGGSENYAEGLRSFLQARNRDDLDFMIMPCLHPWANGTVSLQLPEEQIEKAASVIVDEYLSRPNYLRANDGRKVLAICDPRGIGSGDKDRVDTAAVRAFTDAIRAKAREAFGEDVLITLTIDVGMDLAAGGIDGRQCLARWDPNRSYVNYVDNERQVFARYPGILIRCATSGFDERPRIGVLLDDPGPEKLEETFRWYEDQSPEEFGRLLDLVAADIAESDRPQIVDNMVLVYAWNEWHEGGIIEPNARDGCLYLDIIRDRLSLHGGTGCVANPEPVA